jgi:hypothetical protein
MCDISYRPLFSAFRGLCQNPLGYVRAGHACLEPPVGDIGTSTSDGVINIDPSVLSLSLHSLCRNNLGVSGNAVIVEGLKHNTTLTTLDIYAFATLEIHNFESSQHIESLLVANIWFYLSGMPDVWRSRRRLLPRDTNPCSFRTLWPMLSAVTPGRRSHIRHLTQQDIGDLLFSISREYARKYYARRIGPMDY